MFLPMQKQNEYFVVIYKFKKPYRIFNSYFSFNFTLKFPYFSFFFKNVRNLKNQVKYFLEQSIYLYSFKFLINLIA